jgi:Ca2+-binding RTX toxin-like protein
VFRRPINQRLLATAGVLLALIGAATLYAATVMEQSSANLRMQAFTSGSMSVSSSNAGAAIFDIANAGPGMTGQGEVTIGNTGTASGSLALASFARSNTPGLYGGSLSTRLELRVTDVTAGGDAAVYVGTLFSMPELQLGTLPSGETRTYRFLVTMRDGGSPSSPYIDDNLYQRATTSLGYDWTLTESEDDTEPPEPSPVPPVTMPETGAGDPPPPKLRLRERSLIGDAHPNSLVGTSRDDLIYGLDGADAIFGRGGDDYVFGGAGVDRISGGIGNDRLRGGIGADHIEGGPGHDIIFARDGMTDVLDCGSGLDSAYVDAHDRTRNCEAIQGQYGRLFSGEQPAG